MKVIYAGQDKVVATFKRVAAPKPEAIRQPTKNPADLQNLSDHHFGQSHKHEALAYKYEKSYNKMKDKNHPDAKYLKFIGSQHRAIADAHENLADNHHWKMDPKSHEM
jgi:hypothetical protein